MSKAKNKVCFISVDVEHDHGSDHEKTFHGAERMGEILEILGREKISATLFVTGEVLERYPDLVKDWSGDHEIGCHSYSHTYFDLLPVSSIREELDRFVHTYKRIFEYAPRGLRAPSHVVDNAAIRTAGDAGFYYDSSVVPHYPYFKKYRGYLGKAPLAPYYPRAVNIRQGEVMGSKGGIVELPVTGQLFGIPLAGAWIRGLPVALYKILFAIHKPQYVSFSFHSWDMFHNGNLRTKLPEILGLLKKHGYQFKRGDEIFNGHVSEN